MIFFEPENHLYQSIDPADADFKWTSVTTLLGNYHKKFDADAIATKCGNSPRGKWGNYTKQQIKVIWADEAARASKLGNWYHDQREDDVLACSTIERHGFSLPVIHPMTDKKGRKVAQSQKLINGIYPELMIYLRSAGVCGQSDLVEVVDDKVYIIDYKTNKEIKYNGFTNWEGVTDMMFSPIGHMEDCNVSHYNLQLSIYMYMILKHNPKLSPGGIKLHHVSFEIEGENEFGYPIHKKDIQGNFIVKEVKEINLPYKKREVIDMFKNHKENK